MEAARFSLEDLELYRLAREFRKKVYRIIKQLPRCEKYCLDPQMRRAAVSITNNIAEEHGRWHYQENMHYCRIARGSTEEVVDDLNVCEDESYGDQGLVAELKKDSATLIWKINGYINYLRNSKQGETG